jgi:hypothetical protein
MSRHMACKVHVVRAADYLETSVPRFMVLLQHEAREQTTLDTPGIPYFGPREKVV